MTKRERIIVLLDNYLDVLEGLRDRGYGDDDGVLALMCRAWNSPAYRELERLRRHLRDQEPFAYWHLAETYLRAPHVPRLVCPHCWDTLKLREQTWPAWTMRPNVHKHGSRNVSLVRRSVRQVNLAVEPQLVAKAVDWLEEHWRGEVFVPDDVLAVLARGEAA